MRTTSSRVFWPRREYGVKTTLGRINDPRNEWLFDAHFGVDVAVSSTAIIAQLLTQEVGVGQIVTLLGLLKHGVAVVELTIPANAPSLGQPLANLGVPHDAMLVVVVRDGEAIVPGPDFVLGHGDEVLAVAHMASEVALRDALVGSA